MWLISSDQDYTRGAWNEYSVGFFRPDGKFHEHRHHLERSEAEEMCAYLNGGTRSNYKPDRHQ